MNPNPTKLDTLDPVYRLEFDAAVVQTWRVTWPDGATEQVQGHSMQLDRERGTAAFHWHYLGAHRVVNLAHVRDIAEVLLPS